MIQLADSNGLPDDANRDTLRVLAKSRGISARNDVLAEVVRRRKLSPNPGDSTSGKGPSPAPGTGGDSNPQKPPFQAQNTCPQSLGTGGDNTHQPNLSPGQQYLTAPAGTAGRTDTKEPLFPGTDICPDCGNHYNEQGSLTRCRDNHQPASERTTP